MVGFIPGFAYLAEVDPRIAAPRRATPRTGASGRRRDRRRPDRNLSGGHSRRLEHHRPHRAQAIRSNRSVPFLFDVGDEVRFRPVSRAEFEQDAE